MNEDRHMSEETLDGVVRALLRAYEEDPRPSGCVRFPDQESIAQVMRAIRRLLFPGYYAKEALAKVGRQHQVGTWLCQTCETLTQIIQSALQHEHPELSPEESGVRAARIAEGLIKSLPKIRAQLRLDAEAALVGDPAAQSVEEVILSYPGFEAITHHRVAHQLYLAGVPHIPRVITERAHHSTGVDIHPGARIGARFFIDHGTGVVIGETTEIGERVKIYQGVTLGALSVRRSLAGAKRHPTLEDGVIIYAGATVLGGETVIGANSVIGGNVWLTNSVPAGTVVLNNPPPLDYHSRKPKLS